MLKISHISKTFNQGTVNEKKAIEDLSLELKQGDFATIIGSTVQVNLLCSMQSAEIS